MRLSVIACKNDYPEEKAILWKNDYPWENCHFAGKLQLQPRLHRKLRAY